MTGPPGHDTQCRSPDPPIFGCTVAQCWSSGLSPEGYPFARGNAPGLVIPCSLPDVHLAVCMPPLCTTTSTSHQHKTYNVQAIIHHPPMLPPLISLPRNVDASLVSALRLRPPYGISRALLHVDTLQQICLLYDSDPHIAVVCIALP